MIVKMSSVARKFKNVVSPEMGKDGFIQLTESLYARIVDEEILQYISFAVKTILRREYEVEYGVMLLSYPSKFFGKTIGGNFSKGAVAGYYDARTKEMLGMSMQQVLTAYREEVLPVLEHSKTIPSFIQCLQELRQQKYYLYKNGHTELTIACAYSLMQKQMEAKSYAKFAMLNFERLYEEQPMRKWAFLGGQRAQAFLDLVEESKENELLSEWRKITIKNLKLSKIIRENNRSKGSNNREDKSNECDCTCRNSMGG